MGIQKPQFIKPGPGATLDWNHPLARGMTGCFLFNENAGNTCQNYAGRVYLTANSAGAPTRANGTLGGGCAQFNGSSQSFFQNINNPEVFATGTYCTLAAYIIPGTNTALANLVVRCSSSSDNPVILIRLRGDIAGKNFEAVQRNDLLTTVTAQSTGGFIVGMPYLVVGTFSLSTDYRYIYVNGKKCHQKEHNWKPDTDD